MKYLVSLGLLATPVVTSAAIAYLFWKVLLTALLTQIPVGVAWAFWAKLATYVVIVGFGGITLPLSILIVGGILAAGMITKIL